jgi:hypothetical protein
LSINEIIQLAFIDIALPGVMLRYGAKSIVPLPVSWHKSYMSKDDDEQRTLKLSMPFFEGGVRPVHERRRERRLDDVPIPVR